MSVFDDVEKAIRKEINRIEKGQQELKKVLNTCCICESTKDKEGDHVFSGVEVDGLLMPTSKVTFTYCGKHSQLIYDNMVKIKDSE